MATKVLRPIAHEDRLSIVDHLDELRSRLIVCLVALAVAFGVCFWQNSALLNVLNRPLPHLTQQGLAAAPNDSVKQRDADLQQAQFDRVLAASPALSATARQQAGRAARNMAAAAQALPRTAQTKEKPITTGVAEPFMTSLGVAAYFALLFSLPVLIYEAYGFVIPALNPKERRTAIPAMLIAPLLFLAGSAFAYWVVLPPAINFLQGYNQDQFQILLQAKSLYTFEILSMLGVGLAFQLPLGLLALHRVGVINGDTLVKHWRYALVIIAVIAAALPGPDFVTTSLEAVPLLVLYLISIVLLKIADRRKSARAAAEATQPLDSGLQVP